MSKLYAVGFGSGDAARMTALCRSCLNESDVVVGYAGYTALLRPLFPAKEFLETGMTRETERCRAAIAMALTGKTVSVVSSGDSGIYGMASLLLELAENEPELEIEVIENSRTRAVNGRMVTPRGYRDA